ncbi:hypothetical protein [Azospirillum thermophilum]|uniref:Uncharacterized protein n=1 Tax=Azospirillum thermophilum TaxID=2202148 RepID=A0A2S2CPW4_9PROT|nr:hypothetical protein [Azospirillum thermophilum]AWK86357.1 hypothetical protein DEW08_08990 [Azospirillum thermophilum]
MPTQDPADDTIRCERCHRPYPADMPGCPNCRAIRKTNILIMTTMVMLILLTVVGWIGGSFFM